MRIPRQFSFFIVSLILAGFGCPLGPAFAGTQPWQARHSNIGSPPTKPNLWGKILGAVQNHRTLDDSVQGQVPCVNLPENLKLTCYGTPPPKGGTKGKPSLGSFAENIQTVSGDLRSFSLKDVTHIQVADFFQVAGSSLGLKKTDLMIPVGKVETDQHERTFQRYQQYFSIPNPSPVQTGTGSGENFVHNFQPTEPSGLPVEGTEYILQSNPGNDVQHVIGKAVTGLDQVIASVAPKISQAEALQKAQEAIAASSYGEIPAAKIVIGFKDGAITRQNARVVYQFTIPTLEPEMTWTAEVAANESNGATPGDIVNLYRMIQEDTVPWNQNVACKGKASELLFKNINQDFVCDKGNDGKYRLMCHAGDPVTLEGQPFGIDVPILMTDGRRPNPQAGEGEDANQDFLFVDNNAVDNSGDPQYEANFTDSEDDFGVTIYNLLQYAERFFSKYFGWTGLDGQGKTPMRGMVSRIDLQPAFKGALAYYSSPSSLVFFADQLNKPDYGRMTVITVGHEVTHGILDNMLGPFKYQYDEQQEMGSLNEGLAEIFGTSFLSDSKLKPTGAAPSADGKPCSELVNPKSYGRPSTYEGFYFVRKWTLGDDSPLFFYMEPGENMATCKKEDNYCDMVHRNGTVLGYWYYLVLNGGHVTNDHGDTFDLTPLASTPSESLYNAMQIVFNTMRYTLLPTSTYPDMRLSTLMMTEFLYGKDSKEYKVIDQAWKAVGVGKEDPRAYFYPKPPWEEEADAWPVNFAWEVFPDKEVGWQLVYATTPDFSPVVYSPMIYETDSEASAYYGKPTATFKAALQPNKTYYWRVRAVAKTPLASGVANDLTRGPFSPKLGEGEWSLKGLSEGGWGDIHSLTTNTKKAEPASPPQGETGVDPWETELSWPWVVGAEHYGVTVSKNPAAGCYQEGSPVGEVPLFGSLYDLDNPGEPQKLAFDLEENTKYFWWVMPYSAKDQGGQSLAGDCSDNGRWFETGTSGPKSRPTLISPLNELPFSGDPVTFQWSDVPGAVAYSLTTFARNADGTAGAAFGAPVEVPAPTDTNGPVSVAVPGAASHPGGLCWRVRAQAKSGLLGMLSQTACPISDHIAITSPVAGQEYKYGADSHLKDIPVIWTGISNSNGYLLFYTNYKSNNVDCVVPVPGQDYNQTDNRCPHLPIGSVPFAGTITTLEHVPTTNPVTLVVASVSKECNLACPVQDPSCHCILDQVSAPVTFTLKKESTCGNGGEPEPGEQCDDGNTVNGDGCDSNCTLPACGNNIADTGEQCGEPGLAGCAAGSDCIGCQCKAIVCGDKVVEPPETCDDGPENGQPNKCNTDCKGMTPSKCPNNIKEAGEACDGGDLGGATCQSQGFDKGALSCTNCAFNTSNCAKCGNAVIEAGEQCEPPNTATCGSTCQTKAPPPKACPAITEGANAVSPATYFGVNNGCGSHSSCVFQWNPDPAATWYGVQVAHLEGGVTNPKIGAVVANTSYDAKNLQHTGSGDFISPPIALPSAGDYYWCVGAGNDCQTNWTFNQDGSSCIAFTAP